MSTWNKPAVRFLCTAAVAVSVALPPAFAQEGTEAENPRFEIGAGVSGLRYWSRPEWTSDYMGTLLATASMRLLLGLYVQGTAELGKGDDPYPDWITYKEGLAIKTNAGTYSEGTSLGLRYDIPATTVSRIINTLATAARLRKRDPAFTPGTYGGIDYFCPSVGMVRTTFGVKGNGQKETGPTEIESFGASREFYIADVTGFYAGIAARWRLDTDYTENPGSWFGSYGVDFGARYIRFSDDNRHSPTLEPTSSRFNSYQVYLVGFMKFKLFY